MYGAMRRGLKRLNRAMHQRFFKPHGQGRPCPLPEDLKSGLPGYEEAFSGEGDLSISFSRLEADGVVVALDAR